MEHITFRVSSRMMTRLQDEAKRLDLEHERTTGARPPRPTSPSVAAWTLISDEFDRRDERAKRAREARRARQQLLADAAAVGVHPETLAATTGYKP